MGKIKTVVMGDEIAEEEARQKREAKRVQKKAEKAATKEKKIKEESPTVAEVEMVEKDETEAETPKKASQKSKKAPEAKYHFQPGKKSIDAKSLVDKSQTYSPSDALDLVKKTSYSKFDGSVELTLNVTELGLRGSVSLPFGTGKQIRVKIADDKLIEEIVKTGKIDFDILVADPAMMPKLAKIAKILGPKGLMPNPKTGTISPDPEKLVSNFTQGQIQWKTQNDLPIVHLIIGKVSFETKKLIENFQVIIKSVGSDRIKSAYLKATMGPSIKVLLK